MQKKWNMILEVITLFGNFTYIWSKLQNITKNCTPGPHAVEKSFVINVHRLNQIISCEFDN